MFDTNTIILDSEEVETEEVDKGENVFIQRLITDDEGAENCFMRKFTLKPGAFMPLHEHEVTDHVQYILKGKMKIVFGDETKVVEKGDAIHISSDQPHSYENPYDEEIVFLCIVPGGEIETSILE